jgi:glycosyltransferase involved in cell wall biosynthesis
MKIAVFTRKDDPSSLRIYNAHIVRELKALGVEVIQFSNTNSMPLECDLVWEPALAGRRIPPRILKDCQKPLVVTVHGAAPFNLKRNEIYSWRIISPIMSLLGRLNGYRTLNGWRWLRQRVAAVIVVSVYGGKEIEGTYGVSNKIIYPIHHGVDHEIFYRTGDKQNSKRPYLLHVSQFKPKKNVNRILEAYKLLSDSHEVDLVLILPRYHGNDFNTSGVKVIREELSPSDLAKWYRGALGFLFPSLHETFGMPILEAMACGCPVITSNISACPEVAGDAALLVNPHSVDEIYIAMKRLVMSESDRNLLKQRGLDRAKEFSWHKSAQEHLKVFKRVL